MVRTPRMRWPRRGCPGKRPSGRRVTPNPGTVVEQYHISHLRTNLNQQVEASHVLICIAPW